MKNSINKTHRQEKGILYIGTSNITLPGNKQSFPPAYRDKSRLCYYSSLFNTLEVNSSFYKLPRLVTFQKWSLEVPGNFQFSLKLWQQISHAKELTFEQDDLKKFLAAADGIGQMKGCILVQFPKKISLNYYKQLEALLEQFVTHDTNNSWRKAIEFRDASWYTAETFELLDEYGASLVMHDKWKINIAEPISKANFIYLRFHGPKADYKESYSDAYLNNIRGSIIKWLHHGKDVYAYFNNTIGAAFENAMTLKKIIHNLY